MEQALTCGERLPLKLIIWSRRRWQGVGRRAVNLPLAVVCWEGGRDLPWASLARARLYPTKGGTTGGRTVIAWLGPCLAMIMDDS